MKKLFGKEQHDGGRPTRRDTQAQRLLRTPHHHCKGLENFDGKHALRGAKIMSNKKLGNDFEVQFCEVLFNEGFWCHTFAQNQAGQPADIIAVRDGKAYLIDCKVCSNSTFAFSRIEENQDLAMQHWSDCGNGDGWFALLLEDGSIYMFTHFVIKDETKFHSSLSEKEIREYGTPFLVWLDWLKLKLT